MYVGISLLINNNCLLYSKMVANEETLDEHGSPEVNYKEQYKEMKRKLRLLVYVSSKYNLTFGIKVYLFFIL